MSRAASRKPASAPRRRRLWVRALRWLVTRPATAGGSLIMLVGGALIVTNALAQNGSHPAPLFATRDQEPAADAVGAIPERGSDDGATASSHLDAVLPSPSLPDLPPDADVELAELQLRLAGFGYQVGTIDGLSGPRTNAAISAFEADFGLLPGALSTAALAAHAEALASAPVRIASSIGGLDPGADPIVAAVQRALNELGFGPIRVDGVIGGSTRSAIADFESFRGRPPTGNLDHGLIAEIQRAGALR